MPIHDGTSPWALSEVDAINMSLATIGASPVNDVDTPSVDVSMAKNTLKEISLAVQSHGWYFNTEQDKVWTPDSAGLIPIPDQVMYVDNAYVTPKVAVDERQATIKIRGGKRYLFDNYNKTYTFTSSITTKTVYAYDWNSLPQPAKQYIAIRAARVFQDRSVGSEKHHSFTLRDEQYALSELRRFESETADHSIFDSYAVYRVVDRAYPYVTGL